MRDNTIIDKIARTIERKELGKGGIKKLPFLYADSDIQNILRDQVEPPFAAAVPLTSGVVTDERGMYHDQVTLALLFGDAMCEANPEYNARENERIIDDCKQRAFKWLAGLVPTNEIELVSINGAERVYLENDAFVTGYMLNVTLKETQGYGVCQTR